MTASEDRPWSRRVAPEDEGAGGGRPTPLSPGGQSEPLHYQTVQRPPGSEGQFRPRRPAPERHDEPDLPPTEALPTQDVPRYRPRDFSPEGRRAVPSWAPTAGQTDVPLSERLDYHTLTRAEVRAASQRFGGGAGANDPSPADGSAHDRPAASAEPLGGAHASGGSGSSDGIGSTDGGAPMSTPEQPLTRRQLRALREAQEAERGGSDDAAAQPDTTTEHVAEERPSARPWAPVFYGEPVQGERPEQTDAPETESAPSEEDAAAETPSWSGSAPATFAIPVIPDEPEAHAAEESAEPAAAGAVQASDSTPQRSLDDWVAGLYRDQPAADENPLELVEPPEPARWGSDATAPGPDAPESQATPADSPSVLDDLFSPPTSTEGAGSEAPDTASARPVTDPLEFLDAAPSASDRVDLPAPSAWGAPPVVGQPPVEPPGARVDEPAIPVEAEEVPPAEAGEIHPVVIDAEPLPAEPIAPEAVAEDPAPSAGSVSTPSGHWSAQAADDAQADVASGRDVGGGHGVVTTNALVLPSIPSPELSGPLSTTGEIVITGSIEVPRSLSSTGAHPTQLDQSSLDHELDPGDQQVVSVDSQPVRAIKAVSTHTSTRGMMTSTKPHGNRGLTVLIIVTAGLAVVTLGVLAIGLINNAF